MVACLMSYRALFVKDSGAQRLPIIKGHTSHQQLRYDNYGETIPLEEVFFQHFESQQHGRSL